MNEKNGTFLAQDKSGKSVALEWQLISGQAKNLSDKIKSLSEILVPTYAKIELNFAKNRPDLIANDFMLKPLTYLLKDLNNVDWKLFEEETKKILEDFFSNTDWASYSNDKDINIFVIAKDNANKNLGVIQFWISPEFEENNVKAALYGVLPEHQDRGLEKLLMSSIFKLKSEVKRIFLHTRSTNQNIISEYENWGFTKFAGKIPNWTDLEYFANKSDKLQKLSDSFIVKK